MNIILWAWNISLFSVKRALSHFLHVNANDILTATGGRKKQITANKTPDETLQEVLKLWIYQFSVKYFNLKFFSSNWKKEIIFYKVSQFFLPCQLSLIVKSEKDNILTRSHWLSRNRLWYPWSQQFGEGSPLPVHRQKRRPETGKLYNSRSLRLSHKALAKILPTWTTSIYQRQRSSKRSRDRNYDYSEFSPSTARFKSHKFLVQWGTLILFLDQLYQILY